MGDLLFAIIDGRLWGAAMLLKLYHRLPVAFNRKGKEKTSQIGMRLDATGKTSLSGLNGGKSWRYLKKWCKRI